MSTPANILTAEILTEIPKRYGLYLRIWRNNRVDAMLPGRDGKQRRVQAGINGQADIQGIIAPNGRFLAIEVKAGKDRQSDSQRAYEAMVKSHGGVYLVAHNPEQLATELEAIIGTDPRR